MCKKEPVIALEKPIRKTMMQLAGSRIVVSPDTGPLHMAVALNTPTIGLYGYSNPKRCGPYRKYHDLLIDKYKLEIPPGTTEACGGQAKVIDDPSGNALPGGTLCNFTKCKEAEARCYGAGKTAGCYKCQEVTAQSYTENPTDGKSKLRPSSDVCRQLSIGTTGEGGGKAIDHCFWTTEADLVVDLKASQILGTYFFGILQSSRI